MTPTAGRIVLYVLPDGRSAGQVRPAIVTRVWSPTTVQLSVFIDGTNDYDDSMPGGVIGGIKWATSVSLDEGGQQPNTWHWPPRVG